MTEGLTPGAMAQVVWPRVDLLPQPGSMRDRQLLLGRQVIVHSMQPGWTEVEMADDGDRGYVATQALSVPVAPSHAVNVAGTLSFAAADFKSRERHALSLGAKLTVTAFSGRFAETAHGFVPRAHLCELDSLPDDPVAEAARLLGTPYLWGGNTRDGIDCSGLVQVAAHLCGLACPADSGPQSEHFGTRLAEDAPLRRGDTLYWKGHVAWVADSETILHANAHHMAVTYEPMIDAMERIAAQGDGPVICARRLPERN